MLQSHAQPQESYAVELDAALRIGVRRRGEGRAQRKERALEITRVSEHATRVVPQPCAVILRLGRDDRRPRTGENSRAILAALVDYGLDEVPNHQGIRIAQGRRIGRDTPSAPFLEKLEVEPVKRTLTRADKRSDEVFRIVRMLLVGLPDTLLDQDDRIEQQYRVDDVEQVKTERARRLRILLAEAQPFADRIGHTWKADSELPSIAFCCHLEKGYSPLHERTREFETVAIIVRKLGQSPTREMSSVRGDSILPIRGSSAGCA